MNNKQLIRNRLARLRTLRSLYAPEWIIRTEQLALALIRYKGDTAVHKHIYETYIEPAMNQGSITVSDGEA